MEPLFAPWRSGTKVRQSGEGPGRQTVCVHCTMPTLQSVSSVLSAKQTLHSPIRSEEPGQTYRVFISSEQ